MTDPHQIDHLISIQTRLSNERPRVGTESSDRKNAWREHNVRMIEKELKSEIEFMKEYYPDVHRVHLMSDDELLEELFN